MRQGAGTQAPFRTDGGGDEADGGGVKTVDSDDQETQDQGADLSPGQLVGVQELLNVEGSGGVGHGVSLAWSSQLRNCAEGGWPGRRCKGTRPFTPHGRERPRTATGRRLWRRPVALETSVTREGGRSG